MARKKFKLDVVNGNIFPSNYTMTRLQATLENLQYTDESETLTGAGAVSLAKEITYLSATTGSYALTLADGSVDNERKVFFFSGSGGSFVLTPGKLWNFTTLTFDVNGRFAEVRWLGGKWHLTGGDATPS